MKGRSAPDPHSCSYHATLDRRCHVRPAACPTQRDTPERAPPVQGDLDARFKAAGVQNAYFPQLIPLSFLQKEAQHVEGFAPELALVTRGAPARLRRPGPASRSSPACRNGVTASIQSADSMLLSYDAVNLQARVMAAAADGSGEALNQASKAMQPQACNPLPLQGANSHASGHARARSCGAPPLLQPAAAAAQHTDMSEPRAPGVSNTWWPCISVLALTLP